MIAQLSLFDQPEAAPVAARPPLDPEAQAWLRTIGRSPEGCERCDPARIAYEIGVVERLLDQGVAVDLDELEDLCRYHNNTRWEAKHRAPHLYPRYEALSERLSRVYDRATGWEQPHA